MNQAPSGVATRKREADYLSIVLFFIVVSVALVGVPVFGYVHGYSRLDWILGGVLYMVTGLGITVGYHRLLSHRSFTCPDWVKIALLIAGGWAMQNSALKWCADHLRHHARTDQEDDPYNATKGFWYSHCLWILQKDPYADEKYAAPFRKDKAVMWQARYYVPIVLSGQLFPFLVGFLHGGWMGGLSCYLLAGVGRTFLVLNSTFCINSICHIWGDQTDGADDSSRNSWWVSLITFGEGYHNYHHAYPKDYRNGPKWYNFDPSKWLIYSLSMCRFATNLNRRDALAH